MINDNETDLTLKQNSLGDETPMINTANPNESLYFNRELSWLDFNYRCIEDAYDENNPILEQLNFLAIASSNLDEYYMVRVSGVYDQLHAGVEISETKTNMTPDQLLTEISEKNHRNVDAQYQRFDELKEKLTPLGYQFKKMTDLTDEELVEAKLYFTNMIQPILSPLGVDAYRPFPHLNNKLMNIFVSLKETKTTKKGNVKVSEHQAIVPIPALAERFIIVGQESSRSVILIENLILHFLDELFVGREIQYAYPFRITRNTDLDLIEDDAEDLLLAIEDYIKKRKNGGVVRIEIDTQDLDPELTGFSQFLQESLEVEDRSMYYINGPLDLTFLFGLREVIGEKHPSDLFPPFTPYLNPEHMGEKLFQLVAKQDVFIHPPYTSFDPIISFINHAADDPQTISIKQTLYRVSKNSPIIAGLKRAADNGKEVTVLVELKARFDESNNVFWARELEDAGCHVLYGVSELKTHSKITMVIRKEKNQIKQYVHLGTGNYNDKTAKIYTDMGIFTSNAEIANDATKFFNYLSGYTDRPEYKHLHVSPFAIRDSLMDFIDEEIAYQNEFNNGRIIAKMNSLTDMPLINKLYEASQAGVKIDLIVRGICCLRPGVPGISDNINVRSIVGRFLEHPRIYYFNRNGKANVFLSSADMMTRNMVRRVEIEFPILDPSIQKEIIEILQIQLKDTLKARILQADGTYTRPDRTKIQYNSQEKMMKWANDKQDKLNKVIEKPVKRTWFDRILRRFK